MILAIDVGNTNIVIGGLDGKKQIFSARLASDRTKTSDQYALDLLGVLTMHGVQVAEIEGGILSSVVPYLQRVIPDAVRLLTGIELLIVGPGIKTGLKILMDNPSSVGSDLIVSAVAAKAKYPAPIAIIDMGTATTVVVISAEGNYVGGMIIPGLWTSVNALSAHAAQLPYIDLSGPAKLIGTNTVDCMKSGIIYSTAGSIDGAIDRIEQELGESCTVVSTGGHARKIIPHCHHEILIDPYLLLKGLMAIYEKNT